MGWEHIPWYTITDDFDADFGVDEWHGTNAFIRDGDQIFRTYFINSRGDEAMGSTWSYLDITALGRQEEWEDSPEGYPQTPPYQWWNYHDAYGDRLTLAGARALPRMTDSHTLRMERTYHAPAQAVFDAWTSEEVLRRWFHAEHDWETTEAEVDLRVGGDGARRHARPARRTPSTAAAATTPRSTRRGAWRSPGCGTTTPRGMLIEIDFEETDGVTTVRFTHSGLLGRGGRALARGRLERRAFDNLERALETRRAG